MWHTMHERMTQAIFDEASRTFDKWQFAAGADGTMWVRPAGHRLEAGELRGFLALLGDVCEPDATTEIVFDFDDVRSLEPGWLQVFNGLLDFSQRVRVPCRILSLVNRPAIVPSLCPGTDTAAGPALPECMVSCLPSDA